MTEDDAKQKWCPFAAARAVQQILPSGEVYVARFSEEGKITTSCIASACMAWRITHQWLDNAQQEPSWISYAPYAFEPGEGQERDDGHCGLAGKL